MRQIEGLKAKGFDYLKKITAVDYVDRIEVIYIIYNTESKKEEVVKVELDLNSPSIASVMHIYRAADWYERELQEMFGIKIEGRDAKRLLLEEWNGTDAPLRKSFVWGRDYKRME